MERRFVRVYEEWEGRVDAGSTWRDVLNDASTEDLVGALAVAGARDAVAANVIATELLNRTRRGPFLGATLIGATSVVLTVLLDYLYTGTPLFLESGARAYVRTAAMAALTIASAVAYLMWRGSFRSLRLAVARRADRRF